MNETGDVVLPIDLDKEIVTLSKEKRDLKDLLKASYGESGSMNEPFWHAATDMVASVRLKKRMQQQEKDHPLDRTASKAYLEHSGQIQEKRKNLPLYERAYDDLETRVFKVATLHRELNATVHGTNPDTDSAQDESGKYADEYLVQVIDEIVHEKEKVK